MTANYRDQNIVVMGAGKSGQALARFFADRGARVTLSDRRPAEQLTDLSRLAALGVALDLGGHSAGIFQQADLIALSPGVSLMVPLLQQAMVRKIPILGEVEIASRELRTDIVAVTGTNGKSTTTTLIGEALKAWGKKPFVGGNLGTPLVAAIDQDCDALVVELSSFQLETIDRFHPQVGVLLNLSSDHLDRYPDLDSYYAAKINLFRNMTAADYAVLNADDPLVRELCSHIAAQKIWFSASGRPEGVLTRDGLTLRWNRSGEMRTFDLAALALRGEHNQDNAMAALAAVLLLGCPGEVAWSAICAFTGLEHRMQLVRERQGVRWYNDSKGTNVGSVIKSLAGLAAPVTLIAGGKDKGGDYAPLRPLLEGRVRHLILIGEARQRMAAALDGCCEIIGAASLEEAVARAAELTERGGTVLLSPACSSFDMFASYEQRGQVFERLVRALPEEGTL